MNASKHYQFDEDIAFFKSGWAGTHNIKAGYQLNHLANVINQHGNLPFANEFVGAGESEPGSTTFGSGNCAQLKAEWGGNCAGQYGYQWNRFRPDHGKYSLEHDRRIFAGGSDERDDRNCQCDRPRRQPAP